MIWDWRRNAVTATRNARGDGGAGSIDEKSRVRCRGAAPAAVMPPRSRVVERMISLQGMQPSETGEALWASNPASFQYGSSADC